MTVQRRAIAYWKLLHCKQYNTYIIWSCRI